MTRTKALVTGAAGFVGANLVRRLLDAGVDVVACVRPAGEPWRLDGLDGVRVIALDLEDAVAVSETLRRERPDRVYHLAAHGAYSWQNDRRRIVATNFVAFVDLLDACEAAGVAVVVNAGSSSEYGLKRHAPTEADALDPNSDYAVAKAAASLFGRHATRTRALRVVTLRLYSVFGPWEDPNRLVPALVSHGLQGALPRLADPSVARDFVYVDDAVDAFLAAAASPECGPVYNVASGRQTTLADIVDAVLAVFAISETPRWGSMPDRRWDTDVWVGDASRAAAELGWRASVTLEDGLRRTAEWLRSAPELWQRYGVATISRPVAP